MTNLFSLNQFHSSIVTLSDQKPLAINPLSCTNSSQLNFQSFLQREQLKVLLQSQQNCSLQIYAQNVQLFKKIQSFNLHRMIYHDPFQHSLIKAPRSYQEIMYSPLKFPEGKTLEGAKNECCSKESIKIVKHSPLRSQIKDIVSFFLHESGKTTSEVIVGQRTKYAYNHQLLLLFDTLNERFSSAGKCREDMIRFVLRKALSSMRSSIRNEHKLSSKAASLVFCRKYFGEKSEEMIRENINLDNEEEILNFLLPYKVKSRHRTANNSFITEIFASETFYQDYISYLEKFDDIMKIDNDKKAEKFVDYIMICIQGESIHKLKKYKRLPWLDTWIKSTKVIAHELLTIHQWKSFTKKPRSGKYK